MQQPSIGRIVHFVQGGVHYPAIIVSVSAETWVHLHVFCDSHGTWGPNPGMRHSVPYSEECEALSWHWPELVTEPEPTIGLVK